MQIYFSSLSTVTISNSSFHFLKFSCSFHRSISISPPFSLSISIPFFSDFNSISFSISNNNSSYQFLKLQNKRKR
ncbi:hypothetical protein MtrunA17_Chr3g0119551 [Medicago truncatula]|uniref:Uncharacterized protein n=1 Tax=Medicago truncatula TaxID=3880 RepID=A0A396IX55_MEDTR|nr:hypothetical protein MtrunA17_Chr3g0119551 [Medicago truncatula]